MHGESYDVEINEKKYIVKCKCNSFGTKFRVEIYDGETLITDNGVVLKEKSPKTTNVEVSKEKILNQTQEEKEIQEEKNEQNKTEEE